MSVLDRIVDSTREEVGRRRETSRSARLEAALGQRPEARPFAEALGPARHLGDRRAQAPLAVGRA